MDDDDRQDDLTATRHALHAVAELLLAGPQHATSRTIRLRVTPAGFGTCLEPDLRVEGLELVTTETRVPLDGTCESVARAAGIEARDLREVYADGPAMTREEPLQLAVDAAAVIADVFARGDAALRELAPEEEPVLWPEHFDLGITVDEVNYGVSPGDQHLAAPYAYVGPWTARRGAFWNTDFGAARPMAELPDVPSLVGFFREGAERATSDPPRDP